LKISAAFSVLSQPRQPLTLLDYPTPPTPYYHTLDMNSKLCALCQAVIATTTPYELHNHHPDAKSAEVG
jgi:hypothetical protein